MGKLTLSTKRILTFILTLLIICQALPLTCVSANAHEDAKTVRIGWYKSDLFQEGMSDDAEKSGYSYEYLQKIADYTSWNYEYVYGERGELYNMLVDGEIDMLAGVMYTPERAKTLLFPDSEMGVQDGYYLAVAGDRSDLLEELNYALDTLMSIDPYVLQSIRYETYGSVISGNKLTDEEEQWLEEHPTIYVGYIDDYLPYSDRNAEGQVEGLVIDALNNAFEVLELDEMPEFEFIVYDSQDAIDAALNSEEIDIAFPITNDMWQLEQDDINATIEVVSDSGTLFYKTAGSKNDIHRIAVNENNNLQIEYSQSVYPDATLVYYSDIDKCLDAVLSGQVDGTIMDTLRVQYVTSNDKYDSLSYVQLSASTGKCFGVRAGHSSLLLLLNRAISLLGSSYGVDYSYQYIASFYSYGFGDFIRENALYLGGLGIICIALLVVYFMARLQRKEIEVEEIERLQRQAEAASQAKSIFLFNMSHDIRTPMNAVLGFANLMEKELDDPERLRDHLSKIRLSGEYLLGLINNVLEVARIDSGKETLDENFVDVLDERYSGMFESDITAKNLSFVKEFDVEHRYVFADAQKIREVMLNLLSNAIKYTPNGGMIGLRLAEKPCSKEGYAIYEASVFDNGIGMTKEFQEQIFESFTRERNTTESKVLGTGLGMSIVKKLVDLMDGTINIESAPGKGSTFTVTVELRIAEHPEQYLVSRDEAQQQEIDLSGRRILLAEDNELNAEIAIALLGDSGATTDWAHDGVECVNMLIEADAGYYDLILMDIQMPHLNGYDATRKIRQLEDSAKASIPILAMTANAFEEDKKDALDAGMNGHLAKPIDIQVMIKTLREVLG